MRAPRDPKPRPLSVSLARFSSAVVICAAMFGAARGATLFWDSDLTPGNDAASGAGLGGSGTWDTSTAAWWNGGTVDSIWNNANADTAVFGGSTAGTVNLGAAITVGNLVFNTTGYTLTGSNALTLGTSNTVPAIINLQDPTGSGSVNATISTQIGGNSTSGITLNGNGGTLTLNYAGNQGVTGPLTIRSGTLTVDGAISTLAASTAVTFNGTSAFRLDNVGAGALQLPTTYSLGALTATAGNGAVHIERTDAQNVQLTFASLTARQPGATVRFEANGNGAVLGVNSVITLAGVTPNTFLPGYFAKSETTPAGLQNFLQNGVLPFPSSLGAFAWYDAGGFVREIVYGSDPNTLTTAASSSGNLIAGRHMQITGTQASQGSLGAGSILSLDIAQTAVPTVLNPTPAAVNLNLASGVVLTISSGANGPGSILKVGGDTSTISASGGAAGITAGGGNELIIRTDTSADTLVIAASAPITSTTGALTKAGPGTLILNGTQSFIGTTYLNGGVLSIQGTGALGTGAGLSLAGGTYLLQAGNNNNTVENITTGKNVTVLGTATISVSALAANTASANKTVTFGNLTIGNQVFTADPASTYAIQFLPGSTTTFTDALSPTFVVTGTQATGATPGLTLAGKITGASGLVKRGTGTLALTNNATDSTGNNFGAATGSVVELQGGVLSISSDAALGNSLNSLLLNGSSSTDELLTTATLSSNRSVVLGQVSNTIEVSTLGGANTLTLNGAVTSNISAGLTKLGGGTLVLGGTTNTFGGTGSVINVQAGILQIGAAGALGSSGNTVELNGGSLVTTAALVAPQNFLLAQAANTINTTGALTINGLISSSVTPASLTKTGTGDLTLTNAANSFGGLGSTLDIQGGGTLTVTSGGALGDPGNTVRLTGNFVGNGTSTASQNFTLAEGANATATFTVGSTNTFTLAGILNDGGTNTVNLTKAGPGTLELTNSSNSYGGSGRLITVQQGLLSAASDSALGSSFNTITLGSASTVGGFRALGTFTTARSITLANATNNIISVSQGNALTLSTVFTLPTATNPLEKDDLGTLILTTNQPTWTGAITVNAGAIQILGSSVTTGLGATTTGTTVNNTGGIELSGGVTLTEPLTLNTPADNSSMAGSNFAGALRSLTGTANSFTGAITITGAPGADNSYRNVVFGADSGGTLNLSGPITVPVAATGTNRVVNLVLTGTGSTLSNTLTSTITKANSGTGIVKIVKTGSATSTWTLTPAASNTFQVDALEVRSGILKVTTAAASTGGTLSGSTALTFTGGGTFQYDNTLGTVAKTQGFGALNFSAGDGTVLITRNANFNSTLTFSVASGAPVIRATGATGLFQANGTAGGPSTFSGTPNTKVTLTTSPAYSTSFVYDPGIFILQPSGTVTTTGLAYYDFSLGTLRPLNYSSDTGVAGTIGAAGQLSTLNTKHVLLTATPTTAQTVASLSSLNLGTTTAFNVALASSATLTLSNNGTGAGTMLLAALGASTISGASGASLQTGGQELILRTEAGSTITISVPITNVGAFTKSGAGTVNLSGANAWTGNTYVDGGTLVIQGASSLPSGTTTTLSLGAGGTFTYQTDGDTSSNKEVLATQKNVILTGSATITVAKATTTLSSQLNKTISFGNLTIGNQTLTTTPSNAYGLLFSGTTNFTEDLPTTLNVGGNANSNLVQGMTLAGVVSSNSAVGLIKLGTGSLLLQNAGNTFGGSGAIIDIQAGTVAAGSDGALGNAANNIALDANSDTQGFRATGTFATSRTFSLNKSANEIEVTGGNVLTLKTGLNLGGATPATNALNKNNNGVLELGANSPATWTGTVTINAGAIRLDTGAGLGGAGHAVTISNFGSALQLAGSNVVYNAYPLTLAGTGLNNGGALENVSGNNLFTGAITIALTGNTAIGSTSGTLQLNGGVSAPATPTVLINTVNQPQPPASNLFLAGAGNIDLITTGLPATVGTITKIGTGVASVSTPSTAWVGNLVVNNGTFTVRGAGTKLGAMTTFVTTTGNVTTGAIQINPGATLTVDDSIGTATANRLAGRTVAITGGSLNLIGSGTGNTSETITPSATLFSRGLSTITVTAGTGRQASLVIGGTVNNVAPAQTGGPTGAMVLFRGTNLGAAPAANVATITSTGGFAFVGQNGVAGTNNKALFPWALVDADPINGIGTSFATADNTTARLRPLTAAEYSTILTANANLNLNTVQAMTATTNFNSLTLVSSGLPATAGGGLLLSPLFQLTLSSGGILAQAGNGGISGGTLNLTSANPPLSVWTTGAGTSLTISSTLTGGNGATSAGLVKAGAGTLVLSSPTSSAFSTVNSNGFALSANSFNALTAINQGTIQLAGGNNTLFANAYVEVGPGATLDLAGTSQYVQSLFSDGAVAGAGGIVTSSTGAATLVDNNSDVRNWAGSIQGAVAYSRSGGNTLSIYSDQSYTGITQINGSTTTLRDAGALSHTSAIVINYATLIADNYVSGAGTLDSPDRLNNAAPITLRGATFTLQGRAQSETSETVGAVSVDQGFNVINPLLSGTAITGTGPNINSVDLTLGSLARPVGSSATLLIQGATSLTASTNLGLIGSNPRVLTASLNGVSTATLGGGLTNHIVGGWAENGNDFLTYIPSLGFAPLNATGAFGYDLTNTLVGATATSNVRYTTGTVSVASSTTINALSLGGVSSAIAFTGNSILNLTSGGLIGPNNNQTIGAGVGSGSLTAGGLSPATNSVSDLYVFNRANTLTINSTIVDNSVATSITNARVRAVFTASGGTITLATGNTYTGGTVVNGGTLSLTGAGAIPTAFTPATGLIINGATVNTASAQQIKAGNVVTVNGSSTLNLLGANTLAGLIFNNNGGTSNPTVNTSSSGLTGLLTLGTSGVAATSSNVATTSTLAGRTDLPNATLTPFAIDPILFNGVDVAPTQATLALQGISSGDFTNPDTGGINKTGNGVLQFNAPSIFTGQINVQTGGIQFGTNTNAGSRFANVNLGATARINMNGITTTIGSLSGGGVVTNSGGSVTLGVGFDNTSTTFSGRFARFGDGISGNVNIAKVGTGTMTVTGANSDATGTLSVQAGGVTYSGPASSSFGTNTVLTSGTLTLDNSGTNVNNRLSNTNGFTNPNTTTLNLSGGTVNFNGNANANTTETLTTLTMSSGESVLNLAPNANTMENVIISTTFTGQQAGGTLFIQNLPTQQYQSFFQTAGQASIQLGLTSTSTNVAFNSPAGSTALDTQLAVRPDIVVATDSGPATAFATKDLYNNQLRALANSLALTPEVVDVDPSNPFSLSGSSQPTNYDISSVADITENTNGNSLVLENGAGILNAATTALGRYGPNATPLTQTLLSGGVLVIDGGTTAITVPLLTTGTNVSLIFHAYGNLTITGDVGAGTGGLTKSGEGTLTLTGRGYYTGTTTINDGTFILNGTQSNGTLDNTIAVVANSTVALVSPLTVNGGKIDLNGHNQVFGAISNNNINTGIGGQITNSLTGTTVTLTSATNTSSNFSGTITGDLNFVKTGNSTLTMTSPSTYTGSTTIRGGTVVLRDNGALTATTGVDLEYGTLNIDQTQLNPLGNLNPTRLPSTAPITMFGATFNFLAGGSGDYTASVSDVTVNGGSNIINSQVTGSAGSSAVLTLNSLTVTDPTATLNFAANSGTLGSTAFNPRIVLNSGSPTLTYGIIGPWATVSGSDFATYGANGVVALGTYNTAALATGGAVTNNVSFSASPAAAIGNTVLNVLRVTSPTNPPTGPLVTVTFASASSILTFGDTANKISGGMLLNTTTNIGDGTAAGSGIITSGGNQLYIYTNTSSTINGVVTPSVINSIIQDQSASVPLTLIKSGAQALTLTGNNTYTGGTVVNQGTLTLTNVNADSTAAHVAVPGALQINNATVTLSSANQLRANAAVSLDGAGVLNLTGTNTIGRLTFNNRGGNAAPSVQPTPVTSPAPLTTSNLEIAGGGTATASVPAGTTITSNNDVLTTTPTISGTSLTLSNAQPIISTTGQSPVDLLITAPLVQQTPASVQFGGALTKTGVGSLALNPNLTLTATVDPNQNIINNVNTTGLAAGMSVSGTNITAGTVIVSVLSATQLQLSTNTGATASATQTLTFAGSTFTKGFILSQGSLILASSSVLDPTNPGSSIVVNGPIGATGVPGTTGTPTAGTGLLTLAQNLTGSSANDVAILSDGTLRTLNNPVSVLGDFVFGARNDSNTSPTAGNGVILAGPVTLSPSMTHTIGVKGLLDISTISGQITGVNTPLIKTGSGTLVFSNPANSWTGSFTVTVNGGVLRNGASGAFPSPLNLTVATGAVFDTPGQPSGITQTILNLSGGGALTNSSTQFDSTLYIGGTSPTDLTTQVDNTFAGTIAGIKGDNSGTPPAALNIVKVGAGTLTLTGANTYRGTTEVASGSLRVAVGGSINIAKDFTVDGGATAQIDGTLTADAGSLYAASTNSRIRGSGTISTHVEIESGGIIEPVLNGSSTLTINNGNILDMDAGSTLLYTADSAGLNRITITGPGSLNLPSAGNWTLKLSAGNVSNPSGKVFFLFDGDDDYTTSINGNGIGTNFVGTPIIDFGTTGWSLNTALGAGKYGIQYDATDNAIVLVGVVPEPGTGTMVLGSLVAALGLQRFRRRRKTAAAA